MKKIHKNIFYAPALFAATIISMSGCGDERFLSVEPASIDISSEELDASAVINSSSSWMAWCNAAWLEYDYNENTLLVSVSSANESLEERTAEITLINGDGLTRALRLTQRAKDAGLDVEAVSPVSFAADGSGAQTVTVTARNLSGWGFSKSEPWLTVVRGEDGEGNILTLTVEPSEETDPRHDRLIVFPTNEAFNPLADTIQVVQFGTAQP